MMRVFILEYNRVYPFISYSCIHIRMLESLGSCLRNDLVTHVHISY